MSKYTPGPWKVKFRDFSLVETSEGATVAKCSNLKGFVNLQANAQLIAAAPELLEALKLMVAEKSDYMRINNLGDPNEQSLLKLANAAIAKATGGNNG